MILTYKYRIKDGTVGKHLDRHSRACNLVWNYCCQIQREAQSRWKAGRAVKTDRLRSDQAMHRRCWCSRFAQRYGTDDLPAVCGIA